jgi:methylmalonyl-CoA mutase C-terminal domain/subunit
LWDSGVDAIVPQEARAELIVTTIRDLIAARGRV